MKITTDKALILSWMLLIIYTVICEVQIFMDKVPDATLTSCFFVAFGVAESGYCTYIHKIKKEQQKYKKPLTQGDITGFDDAEVLDPEDEKETEEDNDN